MKLKKNKKQRTRKIKWGFLLLLCFSCGFGSAAEGVVSWGDDVSLETKKQTANDFYQKAHVQMEEQNYLAAFTYMKQAADIGLTEARLGLAKMYEEGLGIRKNFKKAFALYDELASAGDLKAMLQAGLLLTRGLVGPSDTDKAIEYYQRGIENPPSYFSGDYELLAKHQDDESLKIWLDIHYRLGLSYEKGASNYKEALKYYEAGAKAGHTKCQLRAGFLHSQGLGVPKDVKKAEELYLAAAAEGLIDAIEALVFLYNNQHRYKESRQWAEKAIEAGSRRVRKQLAYFLGTGTGGPKNEKRARNLLKKLINDLENSQEQRMQARQMLKSLSKSKKSCNKYFTKDGRSERSGKSRKYKKSRW